MLTLDQTLRSYSGKPGCMCGCQGTYNESARSRKMAMTALLKNPNTRLQKWKSSEEYVGCLFFQTATRARVLYLTAKGVEQAEAMGFEDMDE